MHAAIWSLVSTMLMIFALPSVTLSGGSSSVPIHVAQQNTLETFTVKTESITLEDSRAGTVQPLAVVTAKVQLENTGMTERKDVLLRVGLQDSFGRRISDSSVLVYVPFKQLRTYTVSILTRSAGSYNVVSEVYSDGKSITSEPLDLKIPVTNILSMQR